MTAVPSRKPLQGRERGKRHVLGRRDLGKITRHCDVAIPAARFPFAPGEWWRALIVTAFSTGQRIGVLLRWSGLIWTWTSCISSARPLTTSASGTSTSSLMSRWPRVPAADCPGVRPARVPLGVQARDATLYRQLVAIQDAAGLAKRRDLKFHAARRNFVTYNSDTLGPDRSTHEQVTRAGQRPRAINNLSWLEKRK